MSAAAATTGASLDPQDPRILDILRHALGLDERRRATREAYRNHFCTGDGRDLTLCRAAVGQGLMREHPPSEISGGDFVFTVTAQGKMYVDQHTLAPAEIAMRAKWRAKLEERLSHHPAGSKLSVAELLLVVGARPESLIGLCRIESIMPTLGWKRTLRNEEGPISEELLIVYSKGG